jgi:hypothetical protein
MKLPYYIENITHFCKGGAKAPKPPAPPVATTAAENLAKSRILDRQRMARGFSSTILGGHEASKQAPATVLKSLLGE